MAFSAMAATKDVASSRRRRACTSPRFALTPPAATPAGGMSRQLLKFEAAVPHCSCYTSGDQTVRLSASQEGTAMKKSRTVSTPTAVESPRVHHLPLVGLLVDTRTALLELAVRSGLQVLETMLEEDRTAICGPRYGHIADRAASRAGTVASEVVLGRRKVAIRRPRVRANGQEVALPTSRNSCSTNRGNPSPSRKLAACARKVSK
jgi:hypothetical protein